MKSPELASDFYLLDDMRFAEHPAHAAFVKAMKGRAYGRGALNSAWLWFRDGWDNRPPYELRSLLDALRLLSDDITSGHVKPAEWAARDGAGPPKTAKAIFSGAAPCRARGLCWRSPSAL